jgi:hypothetical protein
VVRELEVDAARERVSTAQDAQAHEGHMRSTPIEPRDERPGESEEAREVEEVGARE